MSSVPILEPSGIHATRMSPYAVWCVILAASTIILDGLDNQVLGIAAPSLIAQWSVTRGQLGTVFALGFVGMALGTVIAGWLGDRAGRRGALILGVIVFAVATLLTGFAANLEEITILRVIAGLGLGGVPGTAAALIAEYTPLRLRGLTVTAGVVCASLGGLVGTLTASWILPALGWRWLFYLGGIVPIGCALLLFAALPESPEFLLSRPHRHRELRLIADRIGVSFDLSSAKADDAPTMPSSRALFQGPLLRDTVALCMALFVGLFLIYLMFNWAPTLLFSNGFPVAWAASGLASFNIGGVIGAVVAALLTMRFGSRRVLVGLGLASVIVCLALAFLPIEGARNTSALLIGLFVLGLTASAVQSSIYAVAAYVFPTAVRARGIGFMAGAGRLGAILSAFIGAVVAKRGSFPFFAALAVVMVINSLSLALIRRHIPERAKAPE